jgi:2-keto-myo-inositol isomerase
MTTIPFALNHMTAPALPVKDFFALAASLGISAVEIRNDLEGNAIIDGTPSADDHLDQRAAAVQRMER